MNYYVVYLLCIVGFFYKLSFSMDVNTNLHTISILSLNLHGYHPTGTSLRYIEDKHYNISPAMSYLFYFTLNEIIDGHKKRQEQLAKDISTLMPDIILFQEVGAGDPYKDKNCEDFYKEYPHDSDWINTVLGLKQLLQKSPYQSALVCRGNVGWITNWHTFSNFRIIKYENNHKKIVFDFNSNPYPQGMLIEGYGILAKDPWTIKDNYRMELNINQNMDKFVFQLAIIEHKHSRFWLLVANVHAGHKVIHFEQAVSLRKTLSEFLKSYGAENNNLELFRGLIIAGDFNAYLYRPNNQYFEISTIPWEIKSDSGYFNFSIVDNNYNEIYDTLLNHLIVLNNNQNYKPWANIKPDTLAYHRISTAINTFLNWQEQYAESDTFILKEAIDKAYMDNICKLPANIDASCFIEEKIDHIFYSQHLQLQNGYILYPKNDWYTLNSLSDHPAVYARFFILDKPY